MAELAPQNNSAFEKSVQFLLGILGILLYPIFYIAHFASRLLGVAFGLTIIATLIFFVYAAIWLPNAPKGMEGVAWQPKARLIFRNIKFNIKDHYEKFGFLYEKGAFPRLKEKSKDAAFAAVYSRLAITPEREDENAFLDIMSFAEEIVSRSISNRERLGIRMITAEEVQKSLRFAALIHFYKEMKNQCPNCSPSAQQALASEEVNSLLESCVD